MLIFLVVLAWAIYWLRRHYLRVKQAITGWWHQKTDGIANQWGEQNRTQKLMRVIGLLLALVLLIYMIF